MSVLDSTFKRLSLLVVAWIVAEWVYALRYGPIAAERLLEPWMLEHFRTAESRVTILVQAFKQEVFCLWADVVPLA